MIPVLLIAAVAYWLAAPDPVTAGARTAAGTGARAAGAGARSHWAAGRDGRKLGRTDRRDRWSRSGGVWRNLLRLEHGAVIGGKAAKGAGKLTAAAVRPVPGAVRAGWVQGRDRHRAKAGNRPLPVALDPPWWRREQVPLDDPPHTCSRCGRTGAEDEVFGGYYVPGDLRLCDSCVQWLDRRYPEGWPDDPAEVAEFGQGQRWPSTTVNPQIDPGTGRPEQVQVQPQVQDPGAGGGQVQVQPGDSPEAQVGGQDDLDTDPDPTDTAGPLAEFDRYMVVRDDAAPADLRWDIQRWDPDLQAWRRWGALADDAHATERIKAYQKAKSDRPYVIEYQDGHTESGAFYRPNGRRLFDDDDPTDPPAGTSPAGATPTTEGDPMPSYAAANVPSVELNDLDSLKRFAEYISSLGEDSEFMQIVERCKSLRESLREGGFGGHVDQAGASFEETAAALGQLGTEFCEEAGRMAQLAANVAGG